MYTSKDDSSKFLKAARFTASGSQRRYYNGRDLNGIASRHRPKVSPKGAAF